jgi:hypothetical protein
MESKMIIRILFFLLCIGETCFAQLKNYQDPGAGNPVIPGYFADPTIKKFGDTYYLYATTDGNGGGFGPSQVWISKDFVNWSLQDMNWPATHHYWAPDVTQAKDGMYYLYYCQPVEIFGAKSSSPVGPWTPLLPADEPVVRNFLVPDVITLDGQTFRDDDGKMYMFWGTWGIYPNHGCGVGLFNADMKSFARLDKIPNTIARDFFEAPFMFKRNGIYYLTYSSGRCEDDTYRVQYAVSKTGPMGPFEYGKNNPVLVTNADGSVHGPGHQSVLQEGEDFYLVYHRHNNPHSGGGYHRQVAADKLVFDTAGNIEKLIPSHKGVGYLAKNANPFPDLLFGAKVTASSSYSEEFKPEFAVDQNNGTLWKPENNTAESFLSIDIGAVKQIKSVHTQFEYATWYYQYLIESSLDGLHWFIFADQRNNTTHGSPMIDIGDVKARYLRITILNTEYPGLNKGIWNFKAFEDDSYHPEMLVEAKKPSALTALKPTGLLIHLEADALEIGTAVKEWSNQGKLGGHFFTDKGLSPSVEMLAGRKAIAFPGKSSMTANIKAPQSMLGNRSFSVAMWVYNDSIEDEEPVLSWTATGGIDITNASIGYGSNKRFGAAVHWGWPDMAYQTLPAAKKWHHIAVVFDGTNEKLYVDGVLDHQELKMLFIANLKNFMLGRNDERTAFFSGAIASLKVYDLPLSETEVIRLSQESNQSDTAVYLDAGKLKYGPISSWKNEGYLSGDLDSLSDQTLVDDFSGKLAVKVKANTQMIIADRLNKLLKRVAAEQTSYTIVSVLTAKQFGDLNWHQLTKVYREGGMQTYLDGRRNESKNLEGLFLKPDVKMNHIASVVVYDHNLSLSAIKSLYQKWVSNKALSTNAASFKEQPSALSPGLVHMSANQIPLPGGMLQYFYSAADDKGLLHNSGWINNKEYTDFKVAMNKSYSYTLKVKDSYGNVTLAASPVKISTDLSLFNIYQDNFNADRDYLKGISASMWDGFLGKADLVKSENGVLTLASADTKWDGNDDKGPFLYKHITGDFIAEVMVADVSGLKEKKANGANDAGLMVLANHDYLLQNSIFPGWGVGNMVTSLEKKGRTQTNNAAAWGFYKHLQIQRRGTVFYIRGGVDGLNWNDLPGSPVDRPDLGPVVKVGLFQATYGTQGGYGSFRNFKIIQKK